MKQYTRREFVKIIEQSGFTLNRNKGSHTIFTNEYGKHISIPNSINSCIARRLIKENNLKIE